MEVDTPNPNESEVLKGPVVVSEIEQKLEQENEEICHENPPEVLSTQETLCIRNESTLNTFQTTEPSKDNNNNNHDTWTTREKLLLISFALVNGDSNWSYVCDQLNKLNPNSFIKKKTSAQCSKQYRQIINNFLNKSKDSNSKNQLIDLKKIYNELAEERLNEVNTQFQQFKDEYTHKSNEILYYLDLNLENNENTTATNNKDEPKFDNNFKKMIIKWIDLNMDSKIYDLNDRYNETLIQALRECDKKQSNQINLQLIDALERDAEKKREYDEKLRLAELERIEKERLEREAAELEKKRLEEEEQQRIQRQKELEEELERQRIEKEKKEKEEAEAERLRLEQEQKEKELKLLDELKPEISPENIDESSKESSKFSSEDEIPLLNIIQSRGLLNDKIKSPSPSVSETTKIKEIKTRRSLRKSNKNEDENLVSSASSVSSVASLSSISHKSVSVSCSSISEQDENKVENVVKPSVSSTSSIYDNLDADDNQDIFSKKKVKKNEVKEELVQCDNLVQINIKQEPNEGQNEPDSQSKAINTSTSSSSSSSSKTNEDEKAYRAWKKSIMMILNNVSCHKHATIFMHPVKDEIAPGYSTLIHRPIDLSTIKKNLENGSIRTTKEFQRDIMLMFTNALMYNSSNHNIHKIALEMFKEVLGDIEQLLNAQEGMNENLENLYLNKPLRFKDMRSSSTASDGKASSILSNLNQEAQNDDSVSSLLKKNSKAKDAKNTSKSSLKDESLNDNSSIKSNSSVSTPRQSTGRSRVNSTKTVVKTPKVESKIENKKEEPSNPRKRKPSGNTSTTNLNTSGSNNNNNSKEQAELDTSEVLNEPPKSKRRKSGR
ncbi:unnamed protein product [Brachionus calyciflorus]|uniref:Bromo domain-containing protein n=1 Tax=Brachionus calyciflorus TaxID=104777 RepID=A0A814IU58_9BILA|nr:unnamed protein product [Brachionus calyciflorus]